MNYTGARIVIECLIEQGVDTVFGYPGGAILNIYDELYKNKNRLRHILTAHEQGASHAADGYARSSGKVGVERAGRDESRHGHRDGVHGFGSDRRDHVQRHNAAAR